MLARLSLPLVFLFGLLPYISTIKLPPIPTFWAEWVTVALAIGWLLTLGQLDSVSRPTKTNRVTVTIGARPPLAIPVAVVALAAMVTLLLVQMMAHMPRFPGSAVLVVAALCLAALVCLAGARVRSAGVSATLLDAWSGGLLIALSLNLIAVLLERQGLHVYAYQLGWRDPPIRAEGLLGQPNQLAVFAVLSACAAHYLWLRGKIRSAVHGLVSLMVAIIVTAAGSRAGALIWVAGAGLSWLALRSHPRRATGQRLLVVGAAVFVVAQLSLNLIESAGVGAGSGAMLLRADSQGRIELYRDSWALILRHPLAGVGYGNFMGARWNELSGSLFEPAAHQAHNLVAQLAVEFGVVGAAAVLLPLGRALWCCAAAVSCRAVAPEQYLAASVALLLAGYAMFEYPLWYTFFLLPFALMLGLVVQPDLLVPLSTAPRAVRWAGWGLAAAICAAVAWDYRRSEQIYTSLEMQQRGVKGAKAQIPRKGTREIAVLSGFDLYANLMNSRTLDLDGLFMLEKAEITEAAMLSVTNEETIARHVAVLVVAGDIDAANGVLLKTKRNLDLERRTREMLRTLAPLNPKLADFIFAQAAPPTMR